MFKIPGVWAPSRHLPSIHTFWKARRHALVVTNVSLPYSAGNDPIKYFTSFRMVSSFSTSLNLSPLSHTILHQLTQPSFIYWYSHLGNIFCTLSRVQSTFTFTFTPPTQSSPHPPIFHSLSLSSPTFHADMTSMVELALNINWFPSLASAIFSTFVPFI